MVAMGAALRGQGDLKHPTLIQIATVLANIVLAPVFLFGWGTGRPMGVAGTALASFLAVAGGCVAFVAYFRRPQSVLRFRAADWSPRPALWWEMLRIGLPAGGEFALMAVYFVLVYDIIAPFGAAAQAGFGIGARVMQALFLPAVAIGFATAPVVGQNVGARLSARVREAFRAACAMSVVVMVANTVLCQAAPRALVRVFNADVAVVAHGAEYLRIASWSFVASGVIFVTSSVFQGLGNTVPALAGSLLRVALFAVPAYVMAGQPTFQMRHLWYVSLASVLVQMGVNLWLLRREIPRRLSFTSEGLPLQPPP
jgi:putative MATE family efflux protein